MGKSYSKKENTKEAQKGNRSKPSYKKNGELAIAYNIAYNRVTNFLDNLTETSCELRKRFQEHHIKVGLIKNIAQMKAFSLFDNNGYIDEKSYTIYAELMHFLFKEKAKTINTTIIDHYIPIINLCLLKLWRFRDYHSHYHHSNFGLYFEYQQQCAFINIFNNASNEVRANYSEETFQLYDQLFDSYKFFEKQKARFIINGECINIFLSLFLTKSEMNRFLSDREFCSRTSPLEYKVKREVYTFYCHKDSANIMRKALEKGAGFDRDELLQAREASLQNYINAMPYFMYDSLAEEEQEKYFRRKNRLIEHALDYFADVVKLPGVEWRTNNYSMKLHKIGPKDSMAKPILKKTYRFKAQKEVSEKWKIKEQVVELRLQLNDNVKAQIRIGKRFITHWLALHFFENNAGDKIITLIKDYATAYHQLIKKKNAIEANDKILLEKIHGKDFANNRKILKLLKTNTENASTYKVEVKKRLVARIDYFKEVKERYEKQPTLLHSLQQVKSDEQDEAQLVKLKDTKRTRYQKNNLIKKAIKLIGRVNLEKEMVQQLDRYHYLFDAKSANHDKIIKAFVDKLPGEVQAIYRQAISFDDLFLKIIDLVIVELNKPLKRWGSIAEKGIHYWASKLKVKWYDNNTNRFDRIKKNRADVLLENCITVEDENGKSTEIVLFALPDNFFEKMGEFEKSSLHKILPYEKVNTIITDDKFYNPLYFGGTDLYPLFKELREALKNDKNNANLKMKFGLLNKLRIWKREDAIIEKIKQEYIKAGAIIQNTKFKQLPGEKTYNLQMNVGGVFVKLKHNDIFSTRFFSAYKKFNKLVKYQLHNEVWKKGENKTIEELFTALHQIYRQSRSFISALLCKEASLTYNMPIENNTKETFQNLPFLEFDEIVDQLNITTPNIKKARNNALHADFSDKNLAFKSFDVLKDEFNF